MWVFRVYMSLMCLFRRNAACREAPYVRLHKDNPYNTHHDNDEHYHHDLDQTEFIYALIVK